MRRAPHIRPRAFTLVELLVVIAIITVLIAVLLPVLAVARRSAMDVKCRSNMRQICTALLTYANENKGRFPPNADVAPGPSWNPNMWCDADRLGRYLRISHVSKNSIFPVTLLGGVLVCPEDQGGSRSYAMNYWASCISHTNAFTGSIGPPNIRNAGKAWAAHSSPGSKLILIGEATSHYPDGHGEYMSGVLMGSPGWANASTPVFEPGWEFIGYLWNTRDVPGSRYALWQTEFDWSRHRRRGDGGTNVGENRGRSNIGFADGHVEGFTPDDLAYRKTFRSKFVALWSPIDYQVERRPPP